MALVGQGDSRWIVKERVDGANVNSWHWTEKRITGTAISALKKIAEEFSCEVDGAQLSFAVTDTTGEVSLYNRKGKQFPVFELSVTTEWKLCALDSTEAEKQGAIEIEDLEPDNIDDVELKVRGMDGTSREFQKTVTKHLRALLGEWVGSLVENTAQQQQQSEQQQAQQQQADQQPQPPPPQQTTTTTKPQQQQNQTTTTPAPRKLEYLCRVGDVFAQSPANEAGLVSGDKIIRVGSLVRNAQFASVADTVLPVILAAANSSIEMEVDRQGKVFVVTVRPREWGGGGKLGCMLHPA